MSYGWYGAKFTVFVMSYICLCSSKNGNDMPECMVCIAQDVADGSGWDLWGCIVPLVPPSMATCGFAL